MSSEYQPKDAQKIFTRFKFAAVLELLYAWSTVWAEAEEHQKNKAILTIEGMFGTCPSITRLDERFVPANLVTPKGGGVHSAEFFYYCGNHAAILVDPELLIPFSLASLGPEMLVKSASVMTAFLPLQEEEEQVHALMWLAEVLNVGHQYDRCASIGRWYQQVGGEYLHLHYHPKMATGVGGCSKPENKHRTGNVVAVAPRDNVWYMPKEVPETVERWGRANMRNTPSGKWCARQHVAQTRMMELHNGIASKRLKLQIFTTAQALSKPADTDFTPADEWDKLVEAAKAWAKEFAKELDKPAKKATKKKVAGVEETPPWAYDEKGELSLRYQYIVRAEEVPEEHRYKMVEQFTEELTREWEERQGQTVTKDIAF